ncbi:MAG: SPOR domain-containing protein [Pseudomonadota bacterium]|nr:SPOR domain-containing protein [Pseudomonadota bacterium]
MGLFSFLNKNKQDATPEDSGYFSRDEDSAATTRARAKRASSVSSVSSVSSAEHAAPARGAKTRSADDPVLPEKKRARRRLVGAVALALAVAVGLPMVLDSEPKPLASDIAIQIPSRDKAAPLPLPAAPATTAPVTPADTLDQREQFVEPSKPEPAAVKTVALPAADAKSAPKPEPKKAEPKPPAKAESKPAEPKLAEPKAVVKPPARAEEKIAARPARVEEKPAAKAPEAERALAILEDKPADAAPQKFVVQVAALGTAEKVAELQDKLKQAGIHSYTHKVATAGGERIQVKVGPFSKEEADKMRARLDKVGLAGSMVKPDGK